jgi:hypothetical protein
MDDFSLNALGIICGTDKSQLGFDYLRHYDRALAQFRNVPINMVEIGVFNGASTRMWKRYFPKATIVGVDIQDRCKAYEEDRLKIEIGSQSDGAFIDALMAQYPPTVMIDDGSHIASDIIFTFERAFPAVLPGGCYIIEDLLFHGGQDGERHRGTAPMGAQEYVLTFAKQLMDGVVHPLHQSHASHQLAHSIDRIETVGRAAFIWKKEQNPLGIDYEWLELLVQRSGTPHGWAFLAGYILRNNGPLPVAVRAAKASLVGDENNWSYLSTLGQVLEKAGDLSQAAVYFEQSGHLAPDSWRSRLAADLERVRAQLR